MLLAIDIGNTNCSFGVFARGRLRRRFDLPTRPERAARQVAIQIRRRVKKHRIHFDAETLVVLCSVVPRMSLVLIKALRLLGVHRIKVVGKDIRVPLVNRYRYPRQVGQDRLVGAFAAWRRFRTTCIVCDVGTAITIDVVTKRGEYLGGMIVPGLEISLEALATRTALLPRVALKAPRELLGRDTASSIRSGLIHGYAALCDGLISRLKTKYGPKTTVVATGGASPLIAKHAKTLQRLRPHLILEGLYLLS